MKNKQSKKITKNPILYLFKKTWKYSYHRKKQVILLIVLSAIANIIILARPIVIGRVFDTVQFQSSDPELLKYVIINISLLFFVTLGFWIFHGISRVIEGNNAFFVQKNFKLDLFSKVMDLPAQWHKDHHSGNTIDKVNKAGDRLYSFSENMFQIVESAVRLIGSIVILMFFDFRATIILLVFSFFIIWFILFSDRILKRYYDKIFKAENHLAAGIHDYISNIITVITLRLKKKAYSEMEKRSMKEYKSIFKSNYLIEIKWALISLFISLLTIFLLILNAYSSFKTNGVIVLSLLFILFQYLQSIAGVFFTFAWMFGEWTKQYSAVSASSIIIDEYEKIENKEKYYLPESWESIQLKQIQFSYENFKKPRKKGNIHDASIAIKRNKRIALIGESGSGKSTLLSLFRGLHKEEKSLVYVDGEKMSQGLSHFYNHIILIPQDPEIFNATILENINMGYKFKKSELEKAMDLSNFKEVVDRLENGLKTNVMEKGVSLSGGEKQRLALARGLLLSKKYDFILLDEPTSSVDSKNEIQIYDNIFNYFQDKTIISSIHRLHLLPKFDYIYFFKDGSIIAEGTFETISKKPVFKAIWDKYMESDRVY